MSQVNIRYIVNNVEEAIAFYTSKLGFEVEMHPAPGFASLIRENLRLLLNQPGAGGAGQSDANNDIPMPGGWNRIQLAADDLEATVKQLQTTGAKFRTQIIQGNGGKQILLEDPSGNLIEMFEPMRK